MDSAHAIEAPAGASTPSPVIARATRGGRDESIHRGFGAVTGPSGDLMASFGDPETPVYWRSAAKPFQAMPFLAAGGEAAFALTQDEVALACASHAGEPAHVACAQSMLDKGGFSSADLRCGTQSPHDDGSAAALVRAGQPFTTLHNNCSGKHAAMLLACRLFGFEPRRYEEPDHPLQRMILDTIAFYALFPRDRIEIGIDGCSLPVFRLPISRLATAYARLLAPERLDGEDAPATTARRRVVGAMTGSPFFVSGTGQFTTRFLEAGAGRWIGKEGAEGVYAIGIATPDNRGIAFKIDDGGARSRNAIAMNLLGKIGEWCGTAPGSLAEYVRPRLRNARNIPIGEIIADVPLRRG